GWASVSSLACWRERVHPLLLRGVWLPTKFVGAVGETPAGGEGVGGGAGGPADADLGLNEAVVAAFAGAVQEKYHGPFPALVPLARHVNQVAVSFIAELDGSVEKACFVRAGARSQSDEDGAEQNR